MRYVLSVLFSVAASEAISAEDVCKDYPQHKICYNQETLKVEPNGIHTLNASCPNNTFAMGGGFTIDGPPGPFVVRTNTPGATGKNWLISVVNKSDAAASSRLTAFVICR